VSDREEKGLERLGELRPYLTRVLIDPALVNTASASAFASAAAAARAADASSSSAVAAVAAFAADARAVATFAADAHAVATFAAAAAAVARAVACAAAFAGVDAAAILTDIAQIKRQSWIDHLPHALRILPTYEVGARCLLKWVGDKKSKAR
jgi:hypothetical protein